jgi:hypothetical protein
MGAHRLRLRRLWRDNIPGMGCGEMALGLFFAGSGSALR